MLAGDASVRKEDIKSSVALHGVVNHGLDLALLRSIEASDVNLDSGKQLGDLLLVCFEIRAVKVAQVQGPGTALGELVRGGPADAKRRVCAWELVRTRY